MLLCYSTITERTYSRWDLTRLGSIKYFGENKRKALARAIYSVSLVGEELDYFLSKATKVF